MGKQFLSGYIALAEGEKDPRNLMVAFTIVRVLIIEFDISEHVEVSRDSNSCLLKMNNVDYQSLFNIVFCYFPITFRPPPNDPYGISTDDLRMALLYV